MKICVLASGSAGNCTYINCNNHNILVDAGTSYKKIKDKLATINVDINDIDSVIISHAHIDHVSALKTLYKKIKPNVYMTDLIYEELKEKDDIKYINFNDKFTIDDIKITSFKTSHDTKDSRGFIIEYNNKSVVYLTDTGYVNEKYLEMLSNKNIYIFESNHDVEMLLNGTKPLDRKERVYSDRGHLCNSQSGYYLSKIVGNNTKNILLAHISRKDNTKSLAINTVHELLKKKNKDFVDLKTTDQEEISEVLTL